MKTKSLLIAALLTAFASVSMAQVTLTQSTTDEFLCGTGQNVIIEDDQVSLQSKMTGIDNFYATTGLPEDLMNHELVTWENYVFSVGGYNGDIPVGSVHRASLQASGISSWTSLDDLPVALVNPAVVATQQCLIVMGGKNDEGVSNKIYYAWLEPGTDWISEWHEASFQLPQPLWGAKAIAVHGNIYLIGGANTDDENAVSNKVYRIKPNAFGALGSISEISSLPEARCGHSIASYDSKIYVTGGHDATGALTNTVYCATVNLNGSLSWSTSAAMPVALSGHSAVCTNGFLAVIGGMTAELPSNQIYYTYLDGNTLSWTTANTVLPVRTYSGAACALGGNLFYSGGQVLSGSIVNDMRYAPIVTGDAKVKKSCYISLPFDIGSPMKNVQELNFILAQSSTTSYEVFYRIADENLNFGNWISGGSNGLITINQTCSAIQYMFRITATGTDDLAIEEAQAIITGYTQLEGNLNNISVLTLEDSPYWVTEGITFTSGIHNVEAGVVIYFQKHTGLTINQACVNFNGTEDQPILLSNINNYQYEWDDWWYGVCFTSSNSNNTGVYSNNVSSWSYTTIEHASGINNNWASLYLYRANRPTFTHCTIRESRSDAVSLRECNGTEFTDCTFTDSDDDHAAVTVYSSSPVMTSCVMTNSGLGVWHDTNCFPEFINCVAHNNHIGIRASTPDRDFVYDESTLALYDNDIDILVAGGRMYDSRTWNYYDNGYWIDGTLEINDSDKPTLTIAPGNTIRMEPGKEIQVRAGGILAVGTINDSITFTAANGEIGGWGGFRFYDASDSDAASSLRYCVVEKAYRNIYCEYTTQPSLMSSTLRQSEADNLYLKASALDLDDVSIRDGGYGLTLTNGSSATMVLVNFDNCDDVCVYFQDATNTATFHTCSLSNSFIGVLYHPNTDIPSYSNNNWITFNNIDNTVAVEGGAVRNCTWSINDYSIFGNIEVKANNTSSQTAQFIIEPGSTLRFIEGTYLKVSQHDNWNYYKGILIAEGTEDAPILFTSLDGEVSWGGIRFYDGAFSSSLKHCVIEKAYDQSVLVDYTSDLLFENCEFRYSDGGLTITHSASPTVRRSVIHHNAGCGIYMENTACPNIGNSPEDANDIYMNAYDNGANIYQWGTRNLDMSYNFLGSMDSTYIENNLVYDKLDNSSKGRINVFPVSTFPTSARTLNGYLLYDGSPDYTMPGSTVIVKDLDDEVLYQTNTDVTGHFTFENMSYGAKKVDFVSNVDAEATITTADALAAMLHYVHETMLSGNHLIVADVNGSGTVNGTDALYIQKRYVHQIESFPAGDLHYEYDTIDNNLNTPNLTLSALCYGDINASYQVLRNGVNLLSEGQFLIGPDQRYDIPVNVQNALEAGALSLKLNYPAEYLSIEQVLLPNGEEAMIYDNDGQVTISWYSLDPMLLSDNDLMLTLGIRTKSLFGLSEPIVFGLDNRSELTDGSAQVLSNVTLTMPELITLGYEGLDENGNFGLSVYPNPMSDRSVVRYNLPTEGRVTFCIYDLLGNAVQTLETRVQSIGQHEIELSGLASGIYMGRLTVSSNREEVQIVKIIVK